MYKLLALVAPMPLFAACDGTAKAGEACAMEGICAAPCP